MLVTIAFIAAIITVIGLTLGLLNQSYQRAANKHFLIQGDVLFSNIISMLKNASSDVNDSTTLDIFLAIPFVFDNSEFDTAASIVFESAASRPNINWLIDANATQDSDSAAPIPLNFEMEAYLDRILSVYNVSDRILLVSMIADAIDSDLEARSSGSELALEHPDFMQGKLYDMHHFNQLIDAYVALTFDVSVREVPWKALIGFVNTELDFNHITPEAFMVIAPDIDPEQAALLTTDRLEVYSTVEDLPLDAETKARMEKLHVAFFSPQVNGNVLIQNGQQKLHATFLYDLKSTKVSDIEISQ